MSDAGEAFTRWRQVAASKLMRKEELEAELLKLRRDRRFLTPLSIPAILSAFRQVSTKADQPHFPGRSQITSGWSGRGPLR